MIPLRGVLWVSFYPPFIFYVCYSYLALNMKAFNIALVLIATGGLTACEEPLTPEAQAEFDAHAKALNQQEAEFLGSVTKLLRDVDPNVREAYFNFNEEGQRVIEFSRIEANGDYKIGALREEQTNKLLDQADKSTEKGNSDLLTSTAAGAGGALLGSMVANLMASSSVLSMSNEDYQKRRTIVGSNYASVMAANQMAQYRNARASGTTMSRNAFSASTRAAIGRTSGGSFGGGRGAAGG